MTKSIFCLAKDADHARTIVDHLLSEDFANENISIVYPDNKKGHGKKTILEENSKAPEGAVTGATAGGILGGSLGLLAGLGAIAIPGIGPFIAAGPIMAALSGSGLGGGLGLLIGTLVGMNIPEYEAKKYEAGLKEGRVLVSVHTESGEEASLAQEIMNEEGGKNISASTETTSSRY